MWTTPVPLYDVRLVQSQRSLRLAESTLSDAVDKDER